MILSSPTIVGDDKICFLLTIKIYMKSNFLSKHKLYNIGILLLVAMSSCISNEKDEPTQADKSGYITCDVVSYGMNKGRALIENDTILQEACSTGGKSIGIWSAYELEGNVVNNVLGNDAGDVNLEYRVNTEWDNYNWWTYGVTAAKWVYGAKYTFNAYYPSYVVNEISSSDISTFVVEYNTEHYQEDLMMAYSYVDTNDSTFFSGYPVQLNMLHTLSALRFRFSFINGDGTLYEESDALTALWLENTVSGRGIATTGVLAFGTTHDNGETDGEHIHWYGEDHPEPSTSSSLRKIYEWNDAKGVNFSSTTTNRNIAVAYSTDSDGKQRFAKNNGWVLTIPQTTDGTSQICFCLKSTGDLVHRITLPSTTFEAGMRYTYDIRLGQTTVSLLLTIAEWNELNSTQDIPL